MSRVVLHRPFWPSYVAFLLFTLILTSTTLQRVGASPLWDFPQNSTPKSSTGSSSEHSMENSMNDSANSSMDSSMDSSTDNSTEISSNTDVIVIKAVVYEIGILTDTDNTTSAESTERQERVDITLYNTPQDDEFS
ncbi:uncharacterized protein LOC112458081 [Temnothorax curvispinosus]|uniref:Uncharacterized protein LOC112458081 n=1 Tax=Temnothorax curvispinosus TaxID=300111 RepID=A0A6J1Q787_9HYME|nr:uncharacterized protein LOC112458081 [Temnothorax curvispinosus]